jgi:hypothetical protein
MILFQDFCDAEVLIQNLYIRISETGALRADLRALAS